MVPGYRSAQLQTLQLPGEQTSGYKENLSVSPLCNLASQIKINLKQNKTKNKQNHHMPALHSAPLLFYSVYAPAEG